MQGDCKTAQSGERIDAPWLRSAAIKAVFAALTSEGGEARVVGGAVRNHLLGQTVTDIDIATTVVPQDVLRLAAARGLGVHPTGFDHGTVTVVSEGRAFEVTTLRRDVETDGRRAVVAFTKNWGEDAERRDFTINALYASPEGALYDFTGGREDLLHHRVRFIGNAQARIREDYLRILRFFRFTASYAQGAPDSDGRAACRALANGLSTLSSERIGAEMRKLVVAPRAAEVMPVMESDGVLSTAIGVQSDLKIFSRLVELETTLGEAPDVVSRLAALVLPAQSAAMAIGTLSDRLRLTNAERQAMSLSTEAHPAYDPATPEKVAKERLYRIGADAFRRSARLFWAVSGAAPADLPHRTRGTLPDRWTPPALPVRGADILALGVAPGPRVGRILEAFEAWWIAQDFTCDTALQTKVLSALATDVN